MKSTSHHDSHRCQNDTSRIHAVDAGISADNFKTINFQCIQLDDVTTGNASQVFITVNFIMDDAPKNVRTCLTDKVDTGAEGNILPLRIYKKTFPNRFDRRGQPCRCALSPSGTILTAYGGTKIEQLGTCTLICSRENKMHAEHFLSSKRKDLLFLGFQWLSILFTYCAC